MILWLSIYVSCTSGSKGKSPGWWQSTHHSIPHFEVYFDILCCSDTLWSFGCMTMFYITVLWILKMKFLGHIFGSYSNMDPSTSCNVSNSMWSTLYLLEGAHRAICVRREKRGFCIIHIFFIRASFSMFFISTCRYQRDLQLLFRLRRLILTLILKLYF